MLVRESPVGQSRHAEPPSAVEIALLRPGTRSGQGPPPPRGWSTGSFPPAPVSTTNRSATATPIVVGASAHSVRSATVTIPAAPLRRRPSVVTKVASSDAARATYRASRTAIRSTSDQAADRRGRRGQRLAPNVASACTRSAARVSWPTRSRRPNAESTSASKWAGAATASAAASWSRKGSAAGRSQIKSTTAAASMTTMLKDRPARHPRRGRRRPALRRWAHRHGSGQGLAGVGATVPSREPPRVR